MRAAQHEEARQQEGGLESLGEEWVSADGTDSPVPLTSPTVGQLKVVVHKVEHDEEIMPDQEYARAVENPEVKKRAKKIAFTKRTMERAVERLGAVIKSADRSTCPQVAIRMKEINTTMECVDTTAEAFGIAIEEACEAVAEHITDGDKLATHENTNGDAEASR